MHNLTKSSRSVALSVVVPCYNEEACIPELVRRLQAACESATPHYEIVLVNDGSRDGTWHLIEAHARTSRVVGVNLSRNHGHQLALTAGLSVCSGDRILIIDADLQDPPELLGGMMALMDDGADVVYGQRLQREGETLFKKATASLFYRLLAQLTETQIPLDTGDFRLISRRALDVFLSMPEHYRFVRGMISWIGLKQVPIAYKRDARFAGETQYPFYKMLRFALDAITGFSIRPLRLAGYFGAILGFAGLFLLAYAIYSWIFLGTVEGWTSLMVVVVLLGSAQMLVLSMMGEYLGRLYMEAKRRPLFVIKEIARAEMKWQPTLEHAKRPALTSLAFDTARVP